jgi:hypothetical protein
VWASDGSSNLYAFAAGPDSSSGSGGTIKGINLPDYMGESTANPYFLYYQLRSLAFDSNWNLWGNERSRTTYKQDVYQISSDTSGTGNGGSVLSDLFPTSTSGGGTQLTQLVPDGAGNVYGCVSGTDVNGWTYQTTLNVFNMNALSGTPPYSSYSLNNNDRGCASNTPLLMDGQGHIFAVFDSAWASSTNIDEFTTTGTMISPPTNGYVGFSGAEAPTLNPDLNVDAPSGVQAAIDGSGNLWVLNNDTNGGYYDADYNIVSNPGNVLVEYVGLAAPVVTPSALAQSNGQLATRP